MASWIVLPRGLTIFPINPWDSSWLMLALVGFNGSQCKQFFLVYFRTFGHFGKFWNVYFVRNVGEQMFGWAM